MEQKITLKNIKSYLEGNTQLALEAIGLQPEHIKEQIAYRRLICNDTCLLVGTEKSGPGHCQYCNCEFYGKTSVSQSCNGGEKFPDLMNRLDWEQYKEKNNINE